MSLPVVSRLVSCAWPGNDFELYSVIENLALSSDNGRIRVSDLPEYLFTEQATEDVSATHLSTSLSFAEIEKEAIINAAQVTLMSVSLSEGDSGRVITLQL